MESRKIILMKLLAWKDWRHRHREQTCEDSGGRRGWDKLRKSRILKWVAMPPPGALLNP